MKLPHSPSFIRFSAMICLVFSTTSTMAASLNMPKDYKQESCVAAQGLRDGFYLGLAGGYDTYNIDANMHIAPLIDTAPFANLNVSQNLSVSGGVGGGFLGYGKYFERYYNTYLGLELFGNWNGASGKYNEADNTQAILASVSGTYLISESSNLHARVKNNFGLTLLPGIKLGEQVLLYVRLGYNWANIETKQHVYDNASFEDMLGVVTPSGSDAQSFSKTVTASGFDYGVGIECLIYENLSMRGDYSQTHFNSFNTDATISHFKAKDSQFMLGLIYHV